MRLSKADVYYWLEKSREYGFLSPQPVDVQYRHAVEFINLIPTLEGKVLDLGAGGGLPGLVILAETDVNLTALDSMKKRTNFLELVSEKSDLTDRFKIVNGRAEELARESELEGTFDLVVARGFGPPTYTAECAARFLKVGGTLAVSGRPIDEHERWDENGLSKLGLSFQKVSESENAHVAIISKTKVTAQSYPRKHSSIRKSPLW